MNSGDLHKIWEIKTLKRKPKEEDARNILDKIAKQVQPIMRKHNWRVKVLSEFWPKNRSLLGLNVGRGIHVKLRLRRPDRDEEFLPYNEVLDTMLHELCHNVHSPHNASFYKLWDELRKECEDLINNGISGTGQGFDLPGKRLGGVSHKARHSSLRQVALTAAENRARLQSLLPSGPKRIGGDTSIMGALSPAQAAAMAAERRLQDNIWCGSEFYDISVEDDCADSLPKSSNKGCCSEISSTAFNAHDLKGKSQKRRRESDDVSLVQSADREEKPIFIDLTNTASENRSMCYSDKMPPSKDYRKDLCGDASASSSLSSHDQMDESSSGTWQCTTCTLFNPQLAPICGLCTAEKPKEHKMKSSFWSCRICTLENDVKIDKCDVCGSWRYSYGPPVATSAPNLGT
ncbi:zinc ion binding protein [Perilla frutescens var. hirtella]|nr:zinc ion binding protein [Perilla frutescens var. frutescens]KAH6775811.1 zinc ion binding protein [Perilla frutescens var. hirtella]